MTVTEETLERIEQHWAVQAVGEQARARATELATEKRLAAGVGRELGFSIATSSADDELLTRVALAFELGALDGIEALLSDSSSVDGQQLAEATQAGAFRAYELLSPVSFPSALAARILHTLHVCALGYCGERQAELRRWLKDHQDHVNLSDTSSTQWDQRLLFRLYDCWLRLFRKDGWDDLQGVREAISELRREQGSYEERLLAEVSQSRTVALRLVALYNWARATELLAVYALQGEPAGIATLLDQHFETARQAAAGAADANLDVLLRWLHLAARRAVVNSIWWVAHASPARTKFVESLTRARSMFELLPPQRAALQEQGLLDQASRAIVVDLPTSGGKTILAQFRMLQALNQFDADAGWVAYVAPTRALVNQVTRRLRQDFGPIAVNVEQLSSAIEMDPFEDEILREEPGQRPFHVLVATPEKLHLLIRNAKLKRPLALLVLDEAHNLEDEERGLRIELLLATVRRESPRSHFLLMMPFVPNAREIQRWLAPEAGRTISMGTSAWKPNELLVGMYEIRRGHGRGNWSIGFEALTTTRKTLHLKGVRQVGNNKPLSRPYNKAVSLSMQTAAMARVFSSRGASIAVARTIPDSWRMADALATEFPKIKATDELGLVQRYLRAEVSPQFRLVELLDHQIGVHHAALSDEARTLIEWLTELGHLRVLCATTGIAQGVNFPVSSVFLATRHLPTKDGRKMSSRAFWNLAGRAGRLSQDSIGVVGIAAGNDPAAIRKYVSDATGALVSRLVAMLDDLEKAGALDQLVRVIHEEQWADFRSFVAHLWNEKRSLDAVLAETEQVLRNTLGYGTLQATSTPSSRRKADALLVATKAYARELAAHPENATLADSTGFAPEGVRSALLGLRQVQPTLQAADWQSDSIFGTGTSTLSQLVGVMLNVPDIKTSLRELAGSHGLDRRRVASLAQAWVNGDTIEAIAEQFFSSRIPDITDAIDAACRGIYRTLANAGTWGLSALSKLPTSGLDFSAMSPAQARDINSLPAMLYYGVKTEHAVVMRMNAVPRSIAGGFGEALAKELGPNVHPSVSVARDFVRSAPSETWRRVTPSGSPLSPEDYRSVWKQLSGEAN
jgi:hypothetical protein